MTHIGESERKTQNRLVSLFKNELRYIYLGNWEGRENNRNIEEELLQKFLRDRGYTMQEIMMAIRKLKEVAINLDSGLYNTNKEVYGLLRYGVNIKPEMGQNSKNVHLIDWKNPLVNDFYIAEEVSIKGCNTKRPDIVVYVNGIALAVIELKRSTVSIAEGIRQNLDNQQEYFIKPFFTTVQLLLAGNDSQGLHYGVIQTKEKFWLRWKEKDDSISNELDRSTLQMFGKERLLEFIRDFLIFDGGVKKAARPNQYFAVKAAQPRISSKESGIIWHSQGSGKSLTMVWLAKWIGKNIEDPRVVIITDRDELDRQIERNFKDSGADIVRVKSGAELISALNNANPWLICSLINKFGNHSDEEVIEVGGRRSSKSLEKYLEDLRAQKLPKDFKAKGNLFVFVDECHRTQGGTLHEAMKMIMGDDVMLIGFTGTPLLKTDKKSSAETFGTYIHTYKFDEAVADDVILDLRYEAREVEQYLGKEEKLDAWFEAHTVGLSSVAKAALKDRWVKLEKLFSSKERMQRIVADICMDMDKKPALSSGYGNAMLVADSIYQAYRYWDFFQSTPLKDNCAVVTSYDANIADIKGETTGEGESEASFKYDTAKKMVGDKKIEAFEQWAKNEFIENPQSMKLLIVVNKLLTGFDAPSATYMYIDKKMQNHDLFQAICRVNRINGDDKKYGYIVDYQDLFNSIRSAIEDYTSESLAGYDREDVQGLLTNRLKEAKNDLDEALQTVITLCEVVNPQTQEGYFEYFVYSDKTPFEEQSAECEANAEKREKLYKLVGNLVRRFVNVANEMLQAGYSPEEATEIKTQVDYYNSVKDTIKLRSGDALDLKRFDPMMRQLIDNWVRADDSEKLFEFEDISFLDLIADEGANAIEKLPSTIRVKEKSVAETLLANMYRVINSERPNNPAYYDKVSALLKQLLEDVRNGRLSYKELIEKLIQKVREMKGHGRIYPAAISTPGMKALYDNLGKNEALTIKVHQTVKENAKDGWRDSNVPAKIKKVRRAVSEALGSGDEDFISQIMTIISNQKEY
ncbi:MAG: HsdR family type I site-specific deoxyribonuclease [Prevotellaceae bacterium]|jgi:type I restriction enzyme R subunit|nr:HsdR family type I site-specific deoxyribonuclease [Prevotellaceae bacterium]